MRSDIEISNHKIDIGNNDVNAIGSENRIQLMTNICQSGKPFICSRKEIFAIFCHGGLWLSLFLQVDISKSGNLFLLRQDK